MTRKELGDSLSRIRAKADYRKYLEADLAAHNLKAWNLVESIRHPEIRYQRYLRRVEYLSRLSSPYSKLKLLMAKYRLLRISEKTGIQIPAGVAGPGLSIAHFGSIVVNSKAKIGSYCRIHSATNIGSTPAGVPEIGNYVYIGPGAILYGPIKIGDGAVIGANSVVNKNVPEGTTVAGVPAKVISQQGSESIMPSWIQPPKLWN